MFYYKLNFYKGSDFSRYFSNPISVSNVRVDSSKMMTSQCSGSIELEAGSKATVRYTVNNKGTTNVGGVKLLL